MIPIGLDRGQRRVPWVSIGLAVANTIVFVQTSSRPDFEQIKVAWGFVPGYGCLDTLISHMFLHDNILHLLGNMIFFIIPAMKLEDAIGGLRMGSLFLLSGVAANACHILIAGATPLPLIGASGAIAGIVGSFMILYPGTRMIFWILPPLPLTLRLPTWFFLGYWFLSEAATGYLIQTGHMNSPVAVWAHVGGFAFGALTMLGAHGWNSGLRLESLRGSLLQTLFAAGEGRRPPRQRPRGRWLALALQSLAVVYMLNVLLAGGLVNPQRPTDLVTLGAAIVPDPARRQVVVRQFRQAVAGRSGQGFFGSLSRSTFLRGANDELAEAARRHRALRRGRIRLPEDAIGSLKRFYAEQYPHFPNEFQMDIQDNRPVSAIYTPGEQYEVLYGSDLMPAMVFCACLAKMNELGWNVDHMAFDLESQTGGIAAWLGPWGQTVAVGATQQSDGYPALSVWKLWRR